MAAKNYRFLSGPKLITAGSLAVIVPTLILVIFQYRSLATLEAHTRTVIQDNLQQTLQSVCASVQTRIAAETEALGKSQLSTLETMRLSGPSAPVENRFAAIRRSQSEIDEVFAFEFETRPPLADFYSQNGFHQVGMYQWSAYPEVQGPIESFNEVNPMMKAREEQLSPAVFTRQELTGCPGVHCESHFYVFLPFLSGGFAGVSLKETYLQEYLANVLPALLDRFGKSASNSAIALAVYDENQKIIFTTAGDHAEFDVKMPFAPAFPHWKLAIGFAGTTISALARQNFERSLLLTAILAIFLALAILLTLRAASQEMKLAEAKSTFVSNVSHELKTPLALIRLFAETLELGRVTSEKKIREYYRIINRESLRLTHLIDNILDFSRMEAGRKEYHFARANIADLVETVLNTYEYQIKNAGFEVTTDIAEDLPDSKIDTVAISQAVLNLLDNAIKYSDEIKQLEVRVENRREQIAIEVADHGIGIAPSEQKKIFEKFYRVSTGLVHTTKGSGLGLALVRHIVEAHGGQVQVESAPGKGSRFTILLPIDSEAMPASAAQSNQTKLSGLSLAEDSHR